MTKHWLAFVIVMFALTVHFADAQTVKVQVDASTVLRSLHPLFYGVNTARWDESLFPGPTDEMLLTCDRDAIAKLKASGVKLLKYPGGNDADHYIWNSPSNDASEMDTDEYLMLCRETGAEPFITVNFNESPELAAEWVRYCKDVRGFPVKYWEVGDEQWGSWAKGHSTPEDYAKKYITFVKAMKAVDPTIKVATNVALGGWSPSLGSKSEGWTARVMKAAGQYVDMLTITFYPQQWGKENDDTLLASVKTYRELFLRLRQEIESVAGKEKANSILYINVGYNSVNHSGGPQTLQVVNALWVADMIGTMAEIGTDLGVYWAVHNYYPPRNGDFGFLSSEGSNTPRYNYYVFPMFADHFGKEIVASTSNDKSIAVHAGKSGKALSIFLINRDKNAGHEVEVSLKKFVPQSKAHVWILDETRRYERLTDLSNATEKFSLNVPPYSLIAIECIAQDSALPPVNLAPLAIATASSFSTIGAHFQPASALDGKFYTKWNSAAWTKSNGEEQQWFQLTWPTPQQYSTVRIVWGDTYATQFSLEVSDEGTQWKLIKEITDGKGGTVEYSFPSTSSTCLRMNGKRGSKGISAYSIREIEVYNK